jgi:hypothetical protein
MEWFPHPLQTYSRCLATFICCGWAHGCVIMPLPPHLLAKIWDVCWKTESHLGYKQYHCAVVEALDPHGMVPTSTSNICKVFGNIHMLWMGILMRHYAITTTLVGLDLGCMLENRVTAGLLTILLCSGWGSRPTWNGSHIHFKHMQGVWQHSYAVDGQMDASSCRYHHTCWPRFGMSAGKLGHSWATTKDTKNAVVEALDPHGMVPTVGAYIVTVST